MDGVDSESKSVITDSVFYLTKCVVSGVAGRGDKSKAVTPLAVLMVLERGGGDVTIHCFSQQNPL